MKRDQFHHFEKPYIFLRDVDVEPIILDNEEIFDEPSHIRGGDKNRLICLLPLAKLEVAA